MEQNTMPNQAELQEEVVLGNRDELLLFHLKAEEKEFVLGLSDVLECLKFAERNRASNTRCMVAYHVRGLPGVKGNSKRNSSGIELTRGLK